MVPDQRTAFAQLYEECHEPFLRYCSSLSFGRMDVEDLVQDVLLSAYKNFSRLQEPDKLLHYLIKAARNRAISLRRWRARSPGIINEQAQRLIAKGTNPDVVLDVQILYRALDKLPAKQREAVVLYEISGFSMREIADIQHSSEGAVKMKVSRGRKALRKLLSDRVSQGGLSPLFTTAQVVLL